MDQLSEILSRERELLELLSVKLEVERLALEGGHDECLATATRDVEEVRSALRATALLRAVVADVMAQHVGLGPNPSLAALADAAPGSWRRALLEQRDALVTVLRPGGTSGPARRAGSAAPHPSLVDFLR